MANASGVNQFAGFPEQTPAYGTKEKQSQLQRLAPLAGTPVPEVRRASQDEKRTPPAAPAPVPPVAAMPVPPTPAGPPPNELYTAISALPGASPLVQEIFGGAQPIQQ